jgi:2-amino-4-hydroxy-6-hydroxymethyldihydropteridine diphosphokinase
MSSVVRAIVALGSNLGSRARNLDFALQQLAPIVALSQVFETEPIGGPQAQGPFLNLVASLDTTLDPHALLRRCQAIEAMAGRTREVRWGPRTLDIDLLFYGDACLRSDELTLPHPRLHERRFVLAPLAEIAPERCPPGWCDALPAQGVLPRGPLSTLLAYEPVNVGGNAC